MLLSETSDMSDEAYATTIKEAFNHFLFFLNKVQTFKIYYTRQITKQKNTFLNMHIHIFGYEYKIPKKHCRFYLWFFLAKAKMQWILSYGISHYTHSNTISHTNFVLLGLEPVISQSK